VTYRLVRPPVTPAAPPTLDPTQRAVVDHADGPLLVLAGPGTGKTTTLVEAVVQRVEDGASPDEVLVLTFSRKAADELRSRIASRLGRTVREPAASTFHSFCYSLLRAYGVGPDGRLPRLLSGAEREMRVRELLVGNANGEGLTTWPADLAPALRLRGFAAEVADLLDRARERGLDAAAVHQLGKDYDRPAWVAAGTFMSEYLDILAVRNEVDYADLVARAVELLDGSAREVCAKFTAVYVDEYQDTDPSQEALLQRLGGGGRLLVAVGDPDQSIYGFRGADVRGIMQFPDRFRRADGGEAEVKALQVCRRSGDELVDLSRTVARRIPLGELTSRRDAHRNLAAQGPISLHPPEIRLFPSVAAEVTGIADLLRRAHLLDGVPWSRMAVLVRSGVRSISTIRRALVAAGVPVSVAADEYPLSQDPAVAPLLRALELINEELKPEHAAKRELTPEVARALLLSPLGGATPTQLRALGRRLRELDREANGGLARQSPTLICEIVADPRDLAAVDDWVARPVRRLTDLLAAARRIASDGGTPAEVLWALWEGSHWARGLSDTASTEGIAGRAADRDLDAVVALFEAATRLADQQPKATVAALLEEIAAQEIPAAPYEEKAGALGAVRLLTAHRSKGLEWDLVIVAGIQEGVWPDLRRRGSVLDADALDADGPREPMTPVSLLADERRLFYVAVTRARERLVLTATSGSDDLAERPSRLLDETGLLVPDHVTTTTDVLSAPSLVARLRRTLTDPLTDQGLRAEAARCLADLATASDDDGEALVPAASPDRWWGVTADSPGVEPVRRVEEPVRLSGSAVASFDRCPRQWFLESEAKANEPSTSSQGFGSIIHALAEAVVVETMPPDLDTLVAKLDSVWHLLPYDARWQAVRDHGEATAALARFLTWHATHGRDCVGAEVEFDILVGDDIRIRGRADRIELDGDGRLVVVDLKTGKSAPTKEKLRHDPQLGVYQLATREGAFAASQVPGGAELVQLRQESYGTVKVQTQDALGDDSWAQELVTGVAAAIRAEAFPARPNERCKACRFRTSCPSGDEGGQVVS
jgi:superfamily I DNA/RNA helicase/RecB family exonuclease